MIIIINMIMIRMRIYGVVVTCAHLITLIAVCPDLAMELGR